MRCIFAIFIILHSGLASAQNSFYGKFEGELILQPLSGVTMKLVKPYAFVDSAGGRWEAPVGTVSDGASIPRFAWSFVGGPWDGPYRNAAVIHDVACNEKKRPWDAVHLAFYHAMLASGVPRAKANLMYGMVYHFGPRWGVALVKREVISKVQRVEWLNDGIFSTPSPVIVEETKVDQITDVQPWQTPVSSSNTVDAREIEKLRTDIEELSLRPSEDEGTILTAIQQKR